MLDLEGNQITRINSRMFEPLYHLKKLDVSDNNIGLIEQDAFYAMYSLWFPVNSYSSQFVLKSIRKHFGQFVLKLLVNSYSFGQFVLMFGQFVLILVNSYSFWSIRTQTQMSTD